ncbi:MAG: type VI secretion system contractile sheath large subunit [Acidobacteriota bacterium]|nr:type VI secretion system contractile sheath large subunit [Acidobacteriota bacterium]
MVDISYEIARTAILDQAIVALDKLIAAQLELIREHDAFKEMYGMWLGLYHLTEAAGRARNVHLDLLNCSKDDLIEDFDAYLDLTDSALFHHLYKREYDQAGGNPYTSVLMMFSFGYGSADIGLLRQVSNVAASCHCPVIADASPALFGLSDFRGLEEINDFDLLFDDQQYTRWRSFGQAEDTRYLGLALPRVRLFYDVKRRIPQYCRTRGLADAQRTWTNASIAFGLILVRSYIKYGWSVYIRGSKTGGLIEAVEGQDLGLEGFEIIDPPLEILFSDRQEHELAAQGLIPLCYHRKKERICLYSAPTLQNVSRLRSDSGQFDRLAAGLPYLYLISRIAHYQKAIQRENVGLTNDSAQLQLELEKWLEKLVTSMRDPSMDQRSERPLAGGIVTVKEDPGSPGFFQVQLIVKPHLQLEGVNAKLELSTKMPREKE